MSDATRARDGYLRAAFDASPLPMIVAAQRVFVAVNAAFERHFGYPADELIGCSTRMMFATDEEFERVGRAYLPACARGETVAVETEMVCRDGRTVPCIFHSHAVDPGDLTKGVIGIVEDVAERRRAEAALRESEARYRSLAENLREYVYRADAQTLRATYVNPAVEQFYGYRAEEWLADPTLWERTLHPGDRERVLAGFRAALASGGDGRIEYRIVRRDGEVRWVTDSFRYERDAAGVAVALNGVMTDVTEQRLTVERLAAGDRAKSAFLAATSHELRTPLNGILGFAELLRDETPPASAARGYAEEIASAGRRLLLLFTDLLDFTRLEEGREPLVRESADVAVLLAEAVAAHGAEAARAGVHLGLQAQGAGRASVDARRLRRLVDHLLSNALKFTPAGGVVTARAARSADGRVLEIAVEDTGIGIAQGDQARLFEPFTQLDTTLARRHGGTGMGLAFVQRIAALHGGEVTMASAIGSGSTFTVRLPLGNGEQAQ